MSERIREFVLQHARLLAVVGAAVALLLTGFLIARGLKQDYRLEAFVAGSDEHYERFQAFTEEFTSNEFALVAVRSKAAFTPAMEAVVTRLVTALREVSAVQKCSAYTDLPGWVRGALGERLLSHPLVAGNLVSEDRRTLAILCQMSAEQAGGRVRRETVAQMKRLVADAGVAHPELTFILTGPYVTLIDMYRYVDRDLVLFTLLATALTLVMLWAVFRRAAPVLFAATVALSAVMVTLGLTVVLGVVTSLITQMIVILLIVLSVANTVHLAVAAEETVAQAGALFPREQARVTLSHMLLPCSAVMFTTAAGFASVCISEIAPVRRFGALMGLGLLWSLAASVVGVVLLHRYSHARPAHGHALADVLRRLAGTAIRLPYLQVVAFVVVTAVVALGARQLRFESDFVKNFRAEDPVRRAYRFVETHLTPLGSLEVVIRREDGKGIATVDNLQQASAFAAGVVGEFAMVRRALTLQDALTLVMPLAPTSNLDVQARLGMLRSWADGAGLVRNFLNEEGTALRVNFRCVEGLDVNEKLAASRRIAAAAEARFGPGYTVEVTGLYQFYAALVRDLLRDQYRALGLTIVVIAMLLAVALRNVRLAAIVMVVNLLPVVLCLGAMGWLEVPVNMTTAMMLSVTLGIAVDDSLHYVWRVRHELASGETDLSAALVRAHVSVGRACVFTTIVIAGGFSILLLSRFLPTAYFGGLVGFTMLGALAADLLLLPALLLLLRPFGR